MTNIVFHKTAVSMWVADMIGKKGPWGDHEAIGLSRDGKLIGGVVVDDYVPGVRCSIHCAGVGKRWLNRQFLWLVFDYVFNQLGCKVVINTVSSTNTESMKFTKHIGFKELGVVPNGFGDADMVIYTLPKADCRWLDLKVR